MTQPVENLQFNIPLVTQQRMPSPEAQAAFDKLIAAVRELQDRVAVLEGYHP